MRISDWSSDVCSSDLFGTRTHKKLHLHLFELAHAHNKLTRNDFVAKSLPNLGNPKGNFHPAGLLNVQKIHKNALSRFGTQVNHIAISGSCSHLGGEHQVKLPDIRPVAGTGYRTGNLVFLNRSEEQ